MSFLVHITRMSGDVLTISAHSSWLVADLYDAVQQMLFPPSVCLENQPFGLFTFAGTMLSEREPLERKLCKPFLTIVIGGSMRWRKHWLLVTPLWLQRATQFVMKNRDFRLLTNDSCTQRVRVKDNRGDAGSWGWWSKINSTEDKLRSFCASCKGVGKVATYVFGTRCCDSCRGTGHCYIDNKQKRRLRLPCKGPCSYPFCNHCRSQCKCPDQNQCAEWEIDRRGSRKSLPVRQQLQMMFSDLQHQSIQQSNLINESQAIEKLIWLRRKRREELFTNLNSLEDSSPKQAYLLRKAVHRVNLQIRRNRKRKTDKGLRRKTQRWGRGKAGKGWIEDDLEMEFHSNRNVTDETGKQGRAVGFESRSQETMLRKKVPLFKPESFLDLHLGYGMDHNYSCPRVPTTRYSKSWLRPRGCFLRPTG
mmetsp:Transcript_63904/g.99565  ORF Transcript_63904/g.99565 Transcript_63904/m.99565 type:complete len:419 (+) Transcript_63904:44-1300(+)